MDNENDDRNKLLANLNASDNKNAAKGQYGRDSSVDGKKNKKCIKISAIVGVVLLVVTIIIIVASKKGGGDDPEPPGPDPPGPVPPISGGYNPYSVSQSTNDGKLIKGYLQADAHVEWSDEERAAYKQLRSSSNDIGVLDPRVILGGENNQVISNVSFELGSANKQCTYLWLDDAENARFSPPDDAVVRPGQDGTARNDMNGMTMNTDSDQPFSFKFTDNKNSSNVLLDTKGGNFLMMDKYMQLDMNLPSRRIYGLGERNRNFTLEEGTWTMWANGQETPFDNGTGGLQTYGVHPFALVQTAIPGEFFGIFFRNANAQSPVLKYNDDGGSTLSYITTGGTLEIYFFWKGSAKQIIQQYQNMFGKPSLPPLWALGWHSSAYAYTTLDMVKNNVESYKNASIPLEGIWLDIPYMSDFEDFTVNSTTFDGLKDFTQSIQANNQRMIVIVDAGIAANDESTYYNDAQASKVLIQSSINLEGEFEGALTAKVWPEHTVFLDFWASGAKKIWAQGLKDLFELVPYDGLWLDMNEATLFCNGECPDTKKTSNDYQTPRVQSVSSDASWYQTLGNQSTNSTYDLPFIPGPVWNLDNMSLSLNATHPEGSPMFGMKQYDTHSLYGHMEAKATKEFLMGDDSVLPGKRTFLLSRSTFAGSGQYTQHWLGDNHRTWDDMRTSIAGVMNFNMFGIPLVGPDTCGFFGKNVTVTQKLCTRWIQLATFYPFARQHRDAPGGGGENGPYAMTEPFQSIAKAALHDRLQYSRHLYSCLYEAQRDGGTCYDPLMFHFPTDDETFAISATEHSFIFANALKVTPVLDEATSDGDSVSSYFPKGTWVSMNNYSDIITSEGGQDGWKDLPVDWKNTTKINTHLMPGAMVTKQEGTFFTTNDLQQGKTVPLTFIANRDDNGAATMKLYLDDGLTIDSEQQTEFYEFLLSANSLKKWNVEIDAESKRGHLDKVVITNAQDLSTTNFACMTTGDDWTHINVKYTYDSALMTLTISSESGDPIMLNELRDIHFGDDRKDINMCNLNSQYHTINGADIDLSGHNASFIMVSDQINLPDLRVNLTLFKAVASSQPIVNVQWSYAETNTTLKKPFEVPKDLVGGPQTKADSLKLSDFVVVSSSNSTPSITIRRGGQDIYSLNSMILDDYFNYIGAVAHTKPNARVAPMGIMGLYERTGNELYLEDGVYSLWSLDTANPVETRTAPGQQEYGTHPFYMGKGTDDKWFGVYTNLAAAQDWWIKNNAETGDVTVRTVASGGLGDLYIILGDTPNVVSQVYQEIVGLPVLPPQWALGWHQCKWGYQNTDELTYVLQNYTSHNLPLDAQWSDIDYLDQYRDFTFDKVNFEYLPSFIDTLHNQSKHYIPIIDAGIAQRPDSDYEVYNDGVTKDVFVKTGDGSEILTVEVWPNEAAFPDFFNPDAQSWWQDWLSKLHESIKFDGLWLDMNEASNFCNGACYPSQQSASPVFHQLPYVPTGRSLESKAMPLDALHQGNVTELDAHSLFGTMEVKATHEWFKSQDKRTMIIERSAFSGLGEYGSRWLGDNFSRAPYMGYSVTGVMAHNVIGIPLAGSDICGFIENTTPELCARWHTVGAFYPFSRNHNAWGSNPQEPYMFSDDIYEGTVTFFDVMKRSMRVKYSMVRYYYTQLHRIHRQGGSLYKPLFFEFPNDDSAYLDQPYNIMLGSALKLGINSNVLDQNTTSILFPQGTWCDIFNASKGCTTNNASTSISLELPSKAYDFHLHIRDGYIVPMQFAEQLNVNTTADLQKEPVDFHILGRLNDTNETTQFYEAHGDYINDDGESTNDTGINAFSISFYQNQSTGGMVFKIAQYQQAEDYKDQGYKVNENDVLGTLLVYNAEATGGDHSSFTVEITTKDGTACTDVPDAVQDKDSDRVIWSPESQLLDAGCRLMPNIEQIVFTANQ